MLKLIKNALNIADNVVDDISQAKEQMSDRIQQINEAVRDELNDVVNQASDFIDDTLKSLDDDNSPHFDSDEPNAANDINNSLIGETEHTVESLLEEIESLKAQISELEKLKHAEARILAEIGDFCALFPDVPVEELPDEVWDSVRKGAPLAASYALYERKKAAEAKRIAQINAKNASRSPGAAGTDTAGEYFTPDEVRRMSRAEVHANYSKIKESMKKWMQK
jgi:DNA repair exonuclease SbcCD ATPase subunit